MVQVIYNHVKIQNEKLNRGNRLSAQSQNSPQFIFKVAHKFMTSLGILYVEFDHVNKSY